MNLDSSDVHFYPVHLPDARPRMIEQVWQQDHVWLENTHVILSLT